MSFGKASTSSNEAWVTLFHEKRNNADVTIGSHLRGGLLYSNPLIRPTAAQHPNPLPQQVLCVHPVTAGDPDQAASSASPLSEPVIDPAEPAATPNAPPWSPLPCTCCATCSPCSSPVVAPQPPPRVDSETPVPILDDTEKISLGKSTI